MKMQPFSSQRWKPAVSKSVLLLMAGSLWVGVGSMLDALACSWLRGQAAAHVWGASVAGLSGALVIHHFGFLRLVDRNLGRILPVEGKRCLFGFMPWKSYLTIAVMITGGYLLRHSSLPRLYLAVLYGAIGTALILSSVRYLRHLVKSLRRPGRPAERPPPDAR